ncbi:MAG: YihY/virulence factor BrkB family protein [Rickettsiales bacterium]|nr:YihY/virulence factor BrkB family protein [Rickettsiales bacterium]
MTKKRSKINYINNLIKNIHPLKKQKSIADAPIDLARSNSMKLKSKHGLNLIKYSFRKYFILPFKIIRIAIFDTINQDGVEHAGYLAFLIILSLFPFLIFLISIVGLIGASEVGIKAIHSILDAAPKEMAEALSPRIYEIISGPPQTFLTIAIIGVIWTASSSVEGCRTILNRAYRVHYPPPYFLRRLISIIEFFVIIFIIVSGIIIFVVAPNILQKIEQEFLINLHINYNFFYIRYLAIFFLLICATSLLYYALPNSKQKFSQTVPGSILTVFLWIGLEHCFAIYLENFHQFSFVYGSLAGVMISLIFFYLISLIFIFGAEFNYHFHRIYKVFLRKKSDEN